MDGGINKFVGVVLFCVFAFGFYRAPSSFLPESVRALRRELLRTPEQKALYAQLSDACSDKDLSDDGPFSTIPASERRSVCLCMADQGVTDLASYEPEDGDFDPLRLVVYLTKSMRACRHPA